jgi:hypothetical protein
VTRLKEHQRVMLDLIKRRADPPPDPYYGRLAASRDLVTVRTAALYWLAFQLENRCQLTTTLLKRLGRFDDVVSTFFCQHRTSPHVEARSDGFLVWLQADTDPVVRAVSQFEVAVLHVKAGCHELHEVLWDRHPDRVLVALETDDQLPGPDGCTYRLVIDGSLPGLLACDRAAAAS